MPPAEPNDKKPAAQSKALAPKTTDDAAADKGNGFPGPDFRQTELTPEQMPASAKVPSPASQVNTSGTSSVGTSGAPVVDGTDEAIAEGQEAYAETQSEVLDNAQKLADAHRKLDEDAAKKG